MRHPSFPTKLSYHLFLYRCPSSYDRCVLDRLSDNIDKAISLHSLAINVDLGKFNGHRAKWINPSVIDLAGIQMLKFSITQSHKWVKKQEEDKQQGKLGEMKSEKENKESKTRRSGIGKQQRKQRWQDESEKDKKESKTRWSALVKKAEEVRLSWRIYQCQQKVWPDKVRL